MAKIRGLQTESDRAQTAANLYGAALAVGFLAMLAANMPGQMSYDSVTQLYEGRHSIRVTWAPALYSAVLGSFDHVVPGTGLYLIATGLLAYGAILALRTLRPALSWTGPIAALCVVALPTLMVFQGEVWKDVLFANLVIAAFVLLAHLVKVWALKPPKWSNLAFLILLLAAAAQTRQNGLIAATVAAGVVAWTVRSRGWRSSLAWGMSGLVAVLLTSALLGALALPANVKHDEGNAQGLGVLQIYDIIGAIAHDNSVKLDVIHPQNADLENLMRHQGVGLYSPVRIDYIIYSPEDLRGLNEMRADLISDQWREVILSNPKAYLSHRLDTFRWVFLTPSIDSCLPLYVGVDGKFEQLASLKLQRGISPTARALGNYGSYFLDSPAYSHLTYALVACVVTVLLLKRREPQDVAIASLMLTALAFTASFFFISLACDYRYLYLLDLAALVGFVYCAIDPPWPWPKVRS